jgi:hypothetical protein
MTKITSLSKYQQALQALPVPDGNGCHQAMMGVCNLGVFARLSGGQIFNDIRSRLHSLGGRKVPDGEITATIRKAFFEANKEWKPSAPVRKIDSPKVREVLNKRTDIDETQLWEMSPIRLLDEPEGDKVLLLKTLYDPSDLIFIGGRESPGIIGDTIRSAADWISYFQAGGKSAEHIIPNPLTGNPGSVKGADKETFRGDACIAKFKFVIVEFDNLPRQEQIDFWANCGLPIHCLIDSGGKSIHGWVKAQNINDAKRWEEVVRNYLFPRILVPLGADSACKNESRLSRLPGHFRADKGNFQKLLWLSNEGQKL